MSDIHSHDVSAAVGHEAADPFVEWDSAYILGALSPAERRSYEAHLTSCPRCRTAVADLAGMPGLLTSIANEFAETPTEAGFSAQRQGIHSEKDRHAPKELLTTLLGTVARRRRRRRALSFVASVAVAAAVALAVVLAPGLRNTSQTPAGIVLDQAVPSPLHAQVRLVGREWGTQLYLTCQYLRDTPGFDTGSEAPNRPDADRYALTVTDRTGHRESIATWTAGPGTTVDPVATTSLGIAQIASVQVVAADGTVLLQHAH